VLLPCCCYCIVLLPHAVHLADAHPSWRFSLGADGPGNFGNHEQNGGRLFSVSKMILEATMYPEAVDDWAQQVRGSTAIASALLQLEASHQTNTTPPVLPYPGLVRTTMPPGSLAQAYCKVAYGPQGVLCCVCEQQQN
jgi:hypothetical protein